MSVRHVTFPDLVAATKLKKPSVYAWASDAKDPTKMMNGDNAAIVCQVLRINAMWLFHNEGPSGLEDQNNINSAAPNSPESNSADRNNTFAGIPLKPGSFWWRVNSYLNNTTAAKMLALLEAFARLSPPDQDRAIADIEYKAKLADIDRSELPLKRPLSPTADQMRITGTIPVVDPEGVVANGEAEKVIAMARRAQPPHEHSLATSDESERVSLLNSIIERYRSEADELARDAANVTIDSETPSKDEQRITTDAARITLALEWIQKELENIRTEAKGSSVENIESQKNANSDRDSIYRLMGQAIDGSHEPI